MCCSARDDMHGELYGDLARILVTMYRNPVRPIRAPRASLATLLSRLCGKLLGRQVSRGTVRSVRPAA